MFDKIRALFAPRQHEPDLDADWLIVGLGNPGAKYAATRHNVGYMAQDMLIDGQALRPLPSFKAQGVLVPDTTALALRSTTFMNNSGEGVAPVAEKLEIPPERIIVLHDELDMPAGKVRIKQGGNENGHNGLKSLTEQLGTRDYIRVRIGIGRPPKGMPVPEWVLSPVDDEGLDERIATAADAARLVVEEGLQRAQNQIHAR
ncbi:peptidyl-tRNA hydrolase [Corynebacterium appendicis CIP 107643]|uniref:Peptidyl-tRNA hydrolase n=1 Tax=Corynebacterium appendicis CIP 107643 TaxID=1161099 RepID=A0A1N7JEH5_9CORY|nr:aminoacyl-tRNA hydrolase [Corynebacterium appendicis]MCT1684683.1 aminoacyl-tRNA hydrolase [Corynebacterium appendicis]WJY60684.1 Peptidyl-tRNA hydrolase [Corynebacterium appendicis CIP 107643]SIS47709.1 peptidyl-tRNA hydrolase [Corynebacterium appendicis CIP 107643]